MSEQKEMNEPYLSGITEVSQCSYYLKHKDDDSKIFSMRGVLFCAYAQGCPKQSEKKYSFEDSIQALLLGRCAIGSSMNIERLAEDTGMPVFCSVSEKELTDKEAAKKQLIIPSSALSKT